MCLTGVVAMLLFIALAVPLIVSARRPKQLAFSVQSIFSVPAANKDTLIDITGNSVVVEGPCNGGCFGGILSQQLPVAIKKDVPGLKGYDGETNTLIWLYQVKPVKVSRRNDLFGEDTVTITGVQTKEQKVYLAVVPKHIVKPRLQWVFVDTMRNE